MEKLVGRFEQVWAKLRILLTAYFKAKSIGFIARVSKHHGKAIPATSVQLFMIPVSLYHALGVTFPRNPMFLDDFL